MKYVPLRGGTDNFGPLFGGPETGEALALPAEGPAEAAGNSGEDRRGGRAGRPGGPAQRRPFVFMLFLGPRRQETRGAVSNESRKENEPGGRIGCIFWKTESS